MQSFYLLDWLMNGLIDWLIDWLSEWVSECCLIKLLALSDDTKKQHHLWYDHQVRQCVWCMDKTRADNNDWMKLKYPIILVQLSSCKYKKGVCKFFIIFGAITVPLTEDKHARWQVNYEACPFIGGKQTWNTWLKQSD